MPAMIRYLDHWATAALVHKANRLSAKPNSSCFVSKQHYLELNRSGGSDTRLRQTELNPTHSLSQWTS
ncbi:hypothetical protein TNCV_4481221 [Trichonephila clavipes]|nr:hypothetical protein TNCV_4481221 [Trichonephila clavipes]